MYGTSGKAYLDRAKARLAEQTQEGLFYAALELRSGIESRIHEYLDAREDIAKRKKHGYQIAKLARGLEAVFAAGEKVVEIRAVNDGGKTLWVLHFTPVRRSLRNHAERLGDLLHHQPYREDDDVWWSTRRPFLEQVANELEFATTGSLMGPPLLEKGTKNMSFAVVADPEDEIGVHLTQIGGRATLKVAYRDDLPV